MPFSLPSSPNGSGKSDTLHLPDHFITGSQAFPMTLSLPSDLPEPL